MRRRRRFRRPAVAAVLTGVAAAACHEATTSPRKVAELPQDISTSIFGCNVSERISSRAAKYQYSWLHFHLPKAALSAKDEWTTLKVRFQESGNEPVAALTCFLPNTQAAIDFAIARFSRSGWETTRVSTGKPLPRFGTDAAIRFALHQAPPAGWGQSARGGTSNQLSSAPVSAVASQYGCPGCPQDLPPVLVTAPYNYGDIVGTSFWTGYGGGSPNPLDASRGDPMYGNEPEPYDPFHQRDPSGCDPYDDFTIGIPQCEQPLEKKDRDLLVKVLADHLNVANVTDPARKARCQEMIDRFQAMFTSDPPRVFKGAYDSWGSDDHYGAWSPETKNIHFDPWAMAAAAAGNANAQYQLANTAIHEAAHDLGHDHGAMFAKLPNIGPVYSEPYFSDLNGGSQSCVRF